MNILSIIDEYGFWDPSGRNLFFKLPKFSFISLDDESKLSADYLLVDNMTPESLDNLFNSKLQRKVYIRKSKIQPSSRSIIKGLPSCLLRYGKYMNGMVVPSINEIVIGVRNPKLQMEAMIKILRLDSSLSKFTAIRPTETYND